MGLYFGKILNRFSLFSEEIEQYKISQDVSESLAQSLFESILNEANEYQETTPEAIETLTRSLLEHRDNITGDDINRPYVRKIQQNEINIFSKDTCYIQIDDVNDDVFFLEQTLLTLATRLSSPTIVSTLLGHTDINPNVADSTGNAPLHIAVSLCRTDIVILLAIHPNIDLLQKNADGKTALELAAEYGDTMISKLLMNAYIPLEKKAKTPRP